MDAQSLTYIFVALSFGLYIGIAIWSRAGSTNEFYVAGGGVHPIANGMATAADWMSAASFISMAGIIAFLGYDGCRLSHGLDRRLRYFGATSRPLPAQIRSVHGAGLHRHSLLFHHRSGHRGYLSDSDFLYLRRGTDAWRRNRVFPVP